MWFNILAYIGSGLLLLEIVTLCVAVPLIVKYRVKIFTHFMKVMVTRPRAPRG